MDNELNSNSSFGDDKSMENLKRLIRKGQPPPVGLAISEEDRQTLVKTFV